MTPEETLVVDRIVLLSKLTKLRQRDCTGSQWSQEWRDNAAERLSSSLSAYVAHGIHDKDGSGRELVGYPKIASGRISSFLREGIPEGTEYAETRQAVLDAMKDYGVVTSVSSLNRCLSELKENKAEVRGRLNAALRRSAEAQGHAGAVTDFTEETAQKIATHFAHLQADVHNTVMSASPLFRDLDVGKADPVSVSWDAQLRARRIAEVEGELAALDTVRAATPHEAERPPAEAGRRVKLKRKREVEPLSWQEQRRRLRSDEAAGVERTPGLRPLERPRTRGFEEIRGLVPRPPTRSR